MHEAAVVGSQEQLTRCFRELQVASQKHEKVAKLEEWFIHARGPRTAPMNKRSSTNFRYYPHRSFGPSI